MNLEMYIEITRISNEESLKDLDKTFSCEEEIAEARLSC